jgi:L-amino acid N-acyltransferase YncA
MQITIRRATVEDASSVADVLNAVIAEGGLTIFDRPFSVDDERRFLSTLGPRSAVHVATINGGLVGVQSVDLFSDLGPPVSHVATMGTWLRSEARGRGIGRKLSGASIGFARSNGYTKPSFSKFSVASVGRHAVRDGLLSRPSAFGLRPGCLLIRRARFIEQR